MPSVLLHKYCKSSYLIAIYYGQEGFYSMNKVGLGCKYTLKQVPITDEKVF